MVGLRAFATGIPAAILMDPRKASAAGTASANCTDTTKAQYLILTTSGSGDPMGANMPGTYLDPKIAHPTGQNMAPTQLSLSGKTYTAAAPWASLPQATLDRTVFFHTGTYTVVHGDEGKTLTLGGAVAKQDMLISLLSSQLAGCLGTVQTQPICIGAQGGSEALSYQGRVQPVLNPAALASVLTLPAGPLANLQTLRDTTLSTLNAWYKQNGTPEQQSFIDRYVSSQDQLRNVTGTLLSSLAAIKDNTPASQVLAATVLFQMNLAPAVSIHLPFGGDNHGDGNLAGEGTQTTASLATINSLLTQLATVNMQDKVTLMGLNVFGRTLASKGTTGRDHNGNLQGVFMTGANFKGGVIGGVKPTGGDYGSMGIESDTGAANDNGDIPFLETFAAMGKTVGRGVGVEQAFLDANITGGKTVTAALK